MSLFLAIYPPQEYMSYFAKVYKHFDKEKRNLKPIPVDHIQVTIKFIGPNVGSKHTAEIIDLFKKFEGQYPKPPIEIESVKFGFARQTDPRYLIANIKQDDVIEELAKDISLLIRSLKFKDTIRWKTRFTNDFHISLARLKPTATRSSGKEVSDLVKTMDIQPPAPFIAEEMVFIESVMTSKGPRYQPLETIKL
ncbi:MAG: RNA 2',3'-cyclic phosphodiesterase [Candidatus Dojkabacteria bacterium]